jgi:hypothetical protein
MLLPLTRTLRVHRTFWSLRQARCTNSKSEHIQGKPAHCRAQLCIRYCSNKRPALGGLQIP